MSEFEVVHNRLFAQVKFSVEPRGPILLFYIIQTPTVAWKGLKITSNLLQVITFQIFPSLNGGIFNLVYEKIEKCKSLKSLSCVNRNILTKQVFFFGKPNFQGSNLQKGIQDFRIFTSHTQNWRPLNT